MCLRLISACSLSPPPGFSRYLLLPHIFVPLAAASMWSWWQLWCGEDSVGGKLTCSCRWRKSTLFILSLLVIRSWSSVPKSSSGQSENPKHVHNFPGKTLSRRREVRKSMDVLTDIRWRMLVIATTSSRRDGFAHA